MTVTLVIPCYNEAIRLDPTKWSGQVHFVFVNDGSTDATAEILNAMKSSQIEVLHLEKNYGKAEAVRRGMCLAFERFPHSEWIGFWDADLATPLNQLNFLLQYNELHGGDFEAIIGSRVLKLGSLIERTFFRHILGRFFITYASLMLYITAYDSQCGAKLFRSKNVAGIFKEPFISMWFFDLEIILRMRDLGLPILECPLQVWRDVDGSKVKPLRDGLRAIFEIAKIRKQYGKRA